MATSISADQYFAATPVETFTLLMNEEFINAKCAATGSLQTSTQIVGDESGPVTIRTVRVLPAEVPAAAKSFVGETIEVTETQEWSAPNSDGTRHAKVSVSFSGPLAFTGTITMTSRDSGTMLHTEGSMKAKVPFIGGQIEEVAVRQTQRYLAAEERIAQEWLSR
jgi:hypothetical protein